MVKMANKSFKELPAWRRLVLLLLMPIVLTTSFIVLAIIMIPCAIWNGIVWSLYWARYKLFGIPIPPKGFIPPEDAL